MSKDLGFVPILTADITGEEMGWFSNVWHFGFASLAKPEVKEQFGRTA